MTTVSDDVLRLLFLDARTQNGWLDRPVDDALLHRLYEVARMGPTSANTQPLRILFVKSPEAKERLKPALAPGNVEKTMTAPVTGILAYDTAYYENLTKLFPHMEGMRDRFAGMPVEMRDKVAVANTWLQGGYVILAARALGLDAGAMAGFDNAKVDAAFFEGQTWRSAFLLNLGYGDPSKLWPRSPRLEFDEACRIV